MPRLVTKLLFSFVTYCSLCAATAAAAETPDIVVFLTDDQSVLDLSLYGSDRGFSTPHAENLAEAGMTFNKAYVASPSCAPSRAALLTGLMPARNGAEPNHSKPRPEIKKWPAYFQDLGYEVVAYGKVSHYKHTVDYGFDSFAHDTFHDHESIPAAVNFLEERDDNATRPLCLMVGSNWPHVPWPKTSNYDSASLKLPEPSIDTTATREARAKLAAAVENADNDLGIIYKAARTHLGNEAIFLFSSDHGTQWPFGKWNCYEEGVHVPLIIEWPGVTKGGAKSDAYVSWVDFLPTLLEAVGGKAPANLDGKSFAPVLKGEKQDHRDRIFTTHSGDGNWNSYPIRALRVDNWKLILNLHPEFAFVTHIDLPGELGRTNYWASWEEATDKDPEAAAIVRRYHVRPAVEFYDLATDPRELKNLAEDPARADRVRQMRGELEAWMEEQGDQKKVYGKPRLVTDKTAFGKNARPPDKD
jgi:arylsulfatase A-like enzyme